MKNLVSKTEALKALKQGKKVRNGTSIFRALGVDNDIIVDQTGFNYTNYFKLYGNYSQFEILEDTKTQTKNPKP